MPRPTIYYDTYFRYESRDLHELSIRLASFLMRLVEIGIDDYGVDKGTWYVEVQYACSVGQARKLGFSAEEIRELKKGTWYADAL